MLNWRALPGSVSFGNGAHKHEMTRTPGVSSSTEAQQASIRDNEI